MNQRTLVKSLLTLAAVSALASCAGPQAASNTGNKRLTPPQEPPVYSWDETAAANTPGAARIKIGLNQQRARFYKGDTEIGWTTVASGISGFSSPTGSFKILEKTVDKKSNLYGRIYNASGGVVNSDAKMGRDSIPAGGRFEGSRMAYWMRLTSDGVGMHIGPLPRPGYPASHGCIRLPEYMAKQFFKHTSIGTPVTIVKDDGTEPLAAARDAYEAELATYTAWANAEWDKHNARMAKTPEARRAAREKLKAEEKAREEAEEAAERLAKAERRAARRGPNSESPPIETRPAELVTDGSGAVPTVNAPVASRSGQTVYLDSAF